jgi:hypothetical protein
MKNLEKSLAVCWEEPPKISLFFDISSGFFREIVESSLIILVARVYKNQLTQFLTLVYWFSGLKSVAILMREGKWGTSGIKYEERYIIFLRRNLLFLLISEPSSVVVASLISAS